MMEAVFIAVAILVVALVATVLDNELQDFKDQKKAEENQS
jgi:hypothetical protein